ncbi:hypothetical protein M378DRAFT_18035 [Amanita muscaria Koide BX008]|uniref:Uncharacterized protein n=1 Tax=Amanita muscaria (strain Koide BX008) TaxID=946122 RepID=A0A0C2W2M9_AMAMK|nr:hypothetical protein M378DRAFT_18035 [Amanita muscaria Koide BX008]
MSSTEGASASMHADPPRDTRQTEKQKEEEEPLLTANEILQMFRESTIQIAQLRDNISELTATVGALQAAPQTAPVAQPTVTPTPPVVHPVVPPSHPKMPKMPLPEAFNAVLYTPPPFLVTSL